MSLDTTGDSDREPGEAILAAASALSGAIRTTLGPNGLDKMLLSQQGTVIVTNDGASILDWMAIADPVGQLVERVASAQDDAVGDGTTTTVLLTGELLQTAKSLREDGIHQTTIVDGYTEAATRAHQQLRDYGTELSGLDDAHLKHVAETAVTGRWDDDSTERFATLTLDALRAIDFDTSRLTLKSYAGGELRDSRHIDGIVIDTDSSSTSLESVGTSGSHTLQSPTIATVDAEIGIEEPNHVQSVQFRDPNQRNRFHAHEQDVRDRIVEQIVELDVDILFCQKSIDSAVRTGLFRQGTLPVERTRQDEFDVIARATGSSAVQSVDQLGPDVIGYAESVAQRTVGTAQTLIVRGCAEERRTSLLLRGGTPHVADEVQRIVSDCIDVVRLAVEDGYLLPGGGAAAVALAGDISATAPGISDRRQLVLEAFADTLEAIPRTLAINAGRDPIDTLSALKQRHDAGDHTVGVGPDGHPCEMTAAGVMEPALVFDSALARAVDVATMVLRIDDVVATSGSDGNKADGHSHSHSGEATGGYPWAVGH